MNSKMHATSRPAKDESAQSLEVRLVDTPLPPIPKPPQPGGWSWVGIDRTASVSESRPLRESISEFLTRDHRAALIVQMVSFGVSSPTGVERSFGEPGLKALQVALDRRALLVVGDSLVLHPDAAQFIEMHGLPRRPPRGQVA